MDVQTPSPHTTLAILLGASAWPASPDFPGSQAFAHAVSSFRQYLLEPSGFGLPQQNALDLFDDNSAPHIIDSKIRQFLEDKISEMKLAGNGAKDLLVYFVGHGGFVGRNSDYYLAVRCTSTEDSYLSGIPMESLASTIIDKACHLRRIIILDCCYSAASFTSFQAEGPARLGIDQTLNTFEKKAKAVSRGTTLLCSSGKTVASQIAQDHSCTMFSKALLQVLLTGDERRQGQPYFSLREIADLTEEVIIRDFEGKAPRPEVHSPDQREGDLALMPFFPNPSAKEIRARRIEEERHYLAAQAERVQLAEDAEWIHKINEGQFAKVEEYPPFILPPQQQSVKISPPARKSSSLQGVLLCAVTALLIFWVIAASIQRYTLHLPVDVTATVPPHLNATAAVVAANSDPYPPQGTLALYDSLSQPDKHWRNDVNSSFGGACQFTQGGYQVSESKFGNFVCDDSSGSDFSNFAFEVQMTITKGGCGGTFFRLNLTNHNHYIFEICQNRSYNFYLKSDFTSKGMKRIISSGSSSTIHSGLNQPNVIAVVANRNNLDLYINNQKIVSANDATYSHGIIGLFASGGLLTEVVFRNVKVWTL